MKSISFRLLSTVALAAGLGAVFAPASAHAGATPFSYSVLAIMTEVKYFVCNAGINTPSLAAPYYYNTLTKTEITAAQCAAVKHNCVTVDRANAYKKNFLVASYGTYTGTTATTTTRVTSANNSIAGTSGAVFNITGNDSWNNKLHSLTFYFGSPTKNAQYFVDLCFRGEIASYDDGDGNGTGQGTGNGNEHQGNGTNTCNGNGTNPGNNNQGGGSNGNCRHKQWTYSTSLTTTNLTGRASYATDAALEGTAYLACDVQDEGTYTEGIDTTSLNRDLIETNISSGFTADVLYSTSAFSVPSGGTQSFFASQMVRNNSNVIRTPRYCKMRLYFSESGGYRDAPTTGTRFTIDTSVTENPPPT